MTSDSLASIVARIDERTLNLEKKFDDIIDFFKERYAKKEDVIDVSSKVWHVEKKVNRYEKMFFTILTANLGALVWFLFKQTL